MNSKVKVKHPFGFQLKIAVARLQEKRHSFNGSLKSETFDVSHSDVQYYVDIFPNGNNEKRRGQTWIFFNLYFKEKKEMKAEFTISIEAANFIHKIEHVFTQPWGRGFSPCTTNELYDPERRFIVDGEMVIIVKGFLMVEKLRKFCENGSSLGMNLWNQDFKDFTIVADGKEIMTHKLILQVCSPVFAAMFQPHTQEAQQNKVIIPDFSFGIVETAMKLCYDPKLVENISFEDQMSLLQFFDKYDMQSLKADLENYIIIGIDEANVCRLANSALISNTQNLQEKCGDLLQQCFRENKLLDDFINLDKEFAYEMFKNSLLKNSP